VRIIWPFNKKEDTSLLKKNKEILGDFYALVENDVTQLKEQLLELFDASVVVEVSIDHRYVSSYEMTRERLSEIIGYCDIYIKWTDGPSKITIEPQIQDVIDSYQSRICTQSPFKDISIDLCMYRDYSRQTILEAAKRFNMSIPKPFIIELNPCNISYLRYEEYPLRDWAEWDLECKDL
jgi:hypothetical protein